jgi:hypothetical protein
LINEKLKSFANRRKSSSLFISNNYREKGDSSLLTTKYFEVKSSIYDKASKSFDKDNMKNEYDLLIKELSSKNIEITDSIEFQILIGKICAIGELIIKNEEVNNSF